MNFLPSDIRIIPAENIKSIGIETIVGDLELVGTNEDQIRIEIYASKRLFVNWFRKTTIPKEELDAHLLMIHQEDNHLRIMGGSSSLWQWDWLSFFQLSFRIFLPKTIDCAVSTTVGTISLNNFQGKHSFRTKIGELLIANIKGEMRGKTMGGNIKIANCDAKTEVSTAGGNILVHNSRGEISLTTSGGNIKVEDVTGKVYTRTGGGNIKAIDVSGEFKTFTGGGNIRLYQMKGNVGASTKGGNVTLKALSVDEYQWVETNGGNITSELPLNQGFQLDMDGTSVHMPDVLNFQGIRRRGFVSGVLNGGGASVKFKSSGGRIRVVPIDIEPSFFPDRPTSIEDIKKKQYNWVEKLNVSKAPEFHSRTSSERLTPVPEQPRERIKEKKHFPIGFKTILSRLNPSSVFYTLLFTTFFVYGLNSILYFSFELLNPTSLEADQNKAVFLANLTVGFACFISVSIYIPFIERFITRNWAKYATLIGFAYLTLFVLRLGQKLLYTIANDGETYWTHYWRIMNFRIHTKGFMSNGDVYALIPGIVVSVFFYTWQNSRNLNRKISEQEYQLLNLEKLKTKAQLNALEARINPHFLYNSLNSITGLIHDNPDKAEEMTIQLSKLFRATTGRSDQSFHSITEELEIVKSYLSIEQMRFGDRLKYSIHLEAGLENIKIPRFLLQPIVENAIKHGISKITEHGIIEVNISKVDDFVEFQIHDNGPAFKEDLSGGYGLRSIDNKLQLIYGNRANLQIQNNDHKAIIIKVPIENLDKIGL